MYILLPVPSAFFRLCFAHEWHLDIIISICFDLVHTTLHLVHNTHPIKTAKTATTTLHYKDYHGLGDRSVFFTPIAQ